MRRLLLPMLLVFVSLCPLAATPPPASAQDAVDPPSLRGEWNGSWTDKRIPQNNGQYSLTIERVEANKVYGQGQLTGWGRSARLVEFKFIGTLEGNVLKFGRETVTELTIDGGTRMRGSSDGPSVSRSITINKHK